MNSTLIANYSAIYAPKNFVYKKNSNVGYDDRHQGQRKLILTEIQHLNQHLENLNEEAIVIYVGAAPNNKALVYNRLYPKVKFILIDPNRFIIKNPEGLDMRKIVADGTSENLRKQSQGRELLRIRIEDGDRNEIFKQLQQS